MKLRIKHRLFLAFLGATGLVVACMFIITKFSFERSLLRYVNLIEQERLVRLENVVADAYAEHGNWEFLRHNRGLELEESTLSASLHGHKLDLAAVEFKLLQHLAAHPGRIFSREQLMDRIYSDRRIVSDRTIDSHIKKLRRKLDAVAPMEQLIRSVYGVGYKFEAEGG